MNLNKYDFIDYFEDQVLKYYLEHGKTWIQWFIAENIIKYFDDYTDEFNQLSEDNRDYIINKLDYNILYYNDNDDDYPEHDYESEYLI